MKSVYISELKECSFEGTQDRQILLSNRYGDKNYLQFQKKCEDGSYMYTLELCDFAKGWLRLIGELNDLYAVDPPGGPYMLKNYFELEFADKVLILTSFVSSTVLIFKEYAEDKETI